MAITLTSSWKEVARKRDTWTGPAAYGYPTRDVTVILYARYDPNERGTSSTKVEQRVDVVFNDAPFDGLWCKDGGHDQGAYYQYTGASSKSWRWDAEGTFQGDGSSTYEDMFPEHWSVACSNYAATLTLSTKWDYPYYGMTSANTQFNADVALLTPPSGGYISSVTPGTNSFTMTGGVTEIGGSSYSVELVVLNAPYTQAGIPQRYEQFHTLSATRTVSNSSSTSSGGITISPNTQYYIGVYANNGDTDLRYDGGTAVTLAPAATVATAALGPNGVDIQYDTVADGGYYPKKIQYSLDGTTWVDGATVSTGTASYGTFSIIGLQPNTTYNIQTRTTTSAGSTTGATLTVTTPPSGIAGYLYGPISDGQGGYETKRVNKLYGSVNGSTKRIVKLYGSVNGQTKLVFEG